MALILITSHFTQKYNVLFTAYTCATFKEQKRNRQNLNYKSRKIKLIENKNSLFISFCNYVMGKLSRMAIYKFIFIRTLKVSTRSPVFILLFRFPFSIYSMYKVTLLRSAKLREIYQLKFVCGIICVPCVTVEKRI